MMDELILLSGTTPEEVAARQQEQEEQLRDQEATRLIRVESAGQMESVCGQCSVVSEIEHCYFSYKKP